MRLAARSTSSHVPEYQRFIDMTYVLRRMQLADAITSLYERKDDVEELVFFIDKNYPITAKDRAILDKAGVEIYNHKIVFSTEPAPHKVYVITRSVIGIYNYLSKGVIEPPVDLKARVLTETVFEIMVRILIGRKYCGMMKIYLSEKQPTDSFVTVPYRGRWYYIKDSDNDSKQSFSNTFKYFWTDAYKCSSS